MFRFGGGSGCVAVDGLSTRVLRVNSMLRLIVIFTIGALVLSGQDQSGRGKGPQAPPKNLRVLTLEELQAGAMRMATQGLGVQCVFCHVDDRSSDEKQQKVTARMMFSMLKDINKKFPDGKVHVTCYTCHRGSELDAFSTPPNLQN